MNICILIRSLAHGGAEKQCLMLNKALQDFANPHLIIIDDEPKHEKHVQYIEREGISHHFLEGSMPQKFSSLRRYLREKKVDILFTYLPSDTDRS
ncbi:MAG: hypothetical protein AAFP02_13500, partial [Bacteroidota bacterium]